MLKERRTEKQVDSHFVYYPRMVAHLSKENQKCNWASHKMFQRQYQENLIVIEKEDLGRHSDGIDGDYFPQRMIEMGSFGHHPPQNESFEKLEQK